MQSYIKNLDALTGLTADQRSLLEARALQHQRFGNIKFTIINPDDRGTVVVRATQGSNQATVYHTEQRLREIVQETFGDVLPKVAARVFAYVPGPTAVVSPAWLQARTASLKTVDMAHDLGIDPAMVSGYVNGSKPMTNTVKAMFYYYLKFVDGPQQESVSFLHRG